MPVYKLYDIDGRGLGEVSRQLFHLSGTPFEDHRVRNAEKTHKQLTPFGKLPVLIVDGKPLPQSFAIARYLAKEFGYAGNTNFEAAWVDAFGDQYKDYLTEMGPFLTVLYGLGQGDKEKLQKEVGEPARDKFFGILEKMFDKSNSPVCAPSCMPVCSSTVEPPSAKRPRSSRKPLIKLNKSPTSDYLVSGYLTWVDLVVADHADLLLQYIPDFLDAFPKALALMKNVQSSPKLKPYLDERRKQFSSDKS